MALPHEIEIVPLTSSVQAEITVPGSKSITNRALILAALANGKTALQGALWSEDTQAMVDCLQKLGFEISVENDPKEFCNRTITVQGLGGKIPRGGTVESPLELFVGNAGTAARFLSAFVCLGKGVYRLHGISRMHERPQGALFKALRELGYRIESEKQNDKLPVRIFGTGPRKGSCTVSIEQSSQFASALILSSGSDQWQVKIVGENADESPYVAMTSNLLRAFPKNGGIFQIEPDASSGSYFWAASVVASKVKTSEFSEDLGIELPTTLLSSVKVPHWPKTAWQIDENFPAVLIRYSFLYQGAKFDAKDLTLLTSSKEPRISRQTDLGDSIMTAIVLAPLACKPSSYTDLGRLRVQECERVSALRTELTKCGAKVEEEGDTLTVYPSELHGAEIETYNDHRMAMCFAILGLKIPGMKLKNPECVKKTFPNFFQKLAAQAPHGLGATILEGKTGRRLTHDELFAD
jgi:3-phosphoshikimate 1-carboxyvinyltransferase